MAQNHDGPRDHTSPMMDERTMREFYGLQFKINVQEGDPKSIMSSYNLVNNIHTSQYQDLLTQMLRVEWGYQYFAVSDWWGTYDEPATLMNAELDIEMPENARFNGLKDAVNNGKVSQDTLNMSVRRTLRSRFRSGIMDPNACNIKLSKTSTNQLRCGKKPWFFSKTLIIFFH